MKNWVLLVLIFFSCAKENKFIPIPVPNFLIEEIPKDYSPIHQEAKNFIAKKGYNDDFYFLIDFSVAPGKNRFFVYDFEQEKMIHKGLVTHGACDVFQQNPTKWKKAKFSNKENSHCSSKGKYVLGNRDVSGWGIGIKYWLNGLEKTNDKAVQRVVVLHSWEAVPDEEVYPKNIALSWGCPAVSNDFMYLLDKKIKGTSNKKILLWIVD